MMRITVPGVLNCVGFSTMYSIEFGKGGMHHCPSLPFAPAACPTIRERALQCSVHLFVRQPTRPTLPPNASQHRSTYRGKCTHTPHRPFFQTGRNIIKVDEKGKKKGGGQETTDAK
ncbi:unnamed protein product [Tuber aestivum]|uniref:Uncharacterized protein n=1 Tax=Tuber aestivum TaxID=59557 RepID=A0A292Q757_9PEZI|nr:unnamed protein product [Tuber aestivum]